MRTLNRNGRSSSQQKKLIITVVCPALLAFFLSCVVSPTRSLPMDEDYPSNGYQFVVEADSIPDTMYTMKYYLVPWKDFGDDKHWTFRAITSKPGVMDTTALHHPDTGAIDSDLDLYFLEEYSDTVKIEGIMWNLNPSHQVGFPVTVIDRFMLEVDSSTLKSNQDVEIAVFNSKPFPSDSLLSVIWYVDGVSADSTSLSHVFTKEAGLTDNFEVTAQIVNKAGIHKNLDTLNLSIRPAGFPVVEFKDERIIVPVNKSYKLSARVENADSVHWISTQGIDTTVAGGLLTHTWTDPSSDTVIAAATNVYGTAFDTVFVVPRMFEYDLSIAAFPSTAQAGQWTTWEVAVERNGQPVPDNQVTYHWSMTGDTAVDSIRTEGGKREMYFRYEKEFVLSVFAEIGSDTTWRHSGVVTVVPDPMIPRVTGLDPDSAWYNTETRLVISAEDNSAVTGYSVSFDNMEFSEWSSDSVYMHSFSDSGVQYVYVRVRDDDGNESMVYYDSVYLLPGYPSVTEIDLMVEDDSVFVLDTISYSITAIDPNKKVRMVYANWDGGTVARDSVEVDADSVTVSIKHAFDLSDSGEQTISVWCRDDDGLVSEAVTKPIIVRLGKPTISVEFPDTVFINVSNEYQVTANDTNGTIEQYAVSWNGGEFITQTEGVFARAFADAGEKIVRAYVTDNDGISSDTVSKTVIVTLGEPAFISITTDSLLSSLYILDPITWTITGTDPNGSVDSVLVSWNGDTIFEERVVAAQSSAALVHTFARADSGQREIRFRVIDNDGFTADSTITVMVLSGAPMVASFTPTETWINDDSTYAISATDENGELIAWFLDKNNDGVWDDTSETGDFVVSFPSAGVQTVRYGVMDEDSVVSSSSTDITVRLGRPMVWSPDGDTLFVVTPATGGEVEFSIESYDTNGTIERYYWDFFGPPFDTSVAEQHKTTVPAIDYTIPPTAVNDPFQMAVFVRDDDNLISGDTLWLLPDAPPPAPTFFDRGTDGDSTVFKWGRKLDVRDGLQTRVQITYCFGDGCAPTDSLYPSGSEPTIAEIEDQWGTEDIGGGNIANIIKADLPQSGLGRWRVILIDARGSRTVCKEGCPATFVAP